MAQVLSPYGYKAHLLWLKDLLYGISYAPEHEEKISFYLLLDPDKSQSFKRAIKNGKPFNIREYATIINPNNEEFPLELKEQLRLQYNAII